MTIASVERVSEVYRVREEAVSSFFEANAGDLARVCHLMARRFARGGRLLAFGAGSAVTDAQHVSVEFVHPVIVGKRALPAVALHNDVASSLALTTIDLESSIARLVEVCGTGEDIAFGMVHSSRDVGAPAVERALDEARSLGMLTISLSAGDGSDRAEHPFTVPSDDPFIVQEIHETAYHVLWELVHVFFEHKGLLEDRHPGSVHDTGRSAFLYPFLAEAETEPDKVLGEVARSIRQKADDVITLRRSSCDPSAMVSTADAIAERVRSGGKILAFGNGGSATDAQDFVTDLMVPPPTVTPISAISLTNDTAVVTAVGNDVGFENVFARQVIAYGTERDVAVAISTSGNSRNVLSALEEANRRGLLTVGLSGYGGGRQAEICVRSHVIDADYIPRLQEAQATQYHVLRGLLAERI